MVASLAREYLDETVAWVVQLDEFEIDLMVETLTRLRTNRGRLFFCGNGGGAAHASHAAADFRKIARIESYCVSDNAAYLTAQINDWTWEDSYSEFLRSSHFGPDDGLFVFSVGGGDSQTSQNIVGAVEYATKMHGKVFAVTGQPGIVATKAQHHIVIGADTPQTEGLQAVVWHLLVTLLAPA